MRIVIIGAGYVGLVTGACFSEFGIDVTCVDQDVDRIKCLQGGEMPIYEPGLEDMVVANVKVGRLHFTTDLATAVRSADAALIAVGTPSRRGDGHADLSFVYGVAEEIARAIDNFIVVITKSTVPVGTGREVARIIREARPDAEFEVVSNPEFLREGSAINDFMRPDRVIIGAESDRAKELMQALYRPLFLIETPILFTGLETAELTKYATNAFLAAKVTFINEMADLCERLGADVYDVARGLGLDGRIGRKFLHPGPGFGGSCFPKDTLALVRTAEMAGSPMRIIETVIDVNDKRKKAMAERIIELCGGSVQGKTLAVLGLAFKPNTDDMRESASLDILPALRDAGATVRVYDPESMEEAKKVLDGLVWCKTAYEAMENADALVILTEWNEFRLLDFQRCKALLSRPLMIDLRNIYDPSSMAAAGFEYNCIGRPRATENTVAWREKPQNE
jgi:UDPglucose 6-dehydrogenase